MSGRFDCIVLGLGAMGSAAAMHLAQRGKRILGLEQFDIPHARGSSHGASRMIRLAYAEHSDYVPLLRRAYELWRDLERRSGESLLVETGGIYLGASDAEFVRGAERAARAHSLSHEMLRRSEIAARFPQFRVPDDFIGFYEPTAGLVFPEVTVGSQVLQALRAGAEIHAHEAVLRWRSDGDEVVVTTARGDYRARCLVVSAGVWAQRILHDAGVEVEATRQVLGWVWPRRRDLFELGTMPVWAIDQADPARGGTHYGFPMLPPGRGGGAIGFKVAHHVKDRPLSDAEVARGDWRTTEAGDEETFRHVLRRFLPDADGALLGLRTCMYENSRDAQFIVDLHPLWPNVAVAAGFSGHGFKFAPVIGEVLADLALEGRTRHAIEFLSLRRFVRS